MRYSWLVAIGLLYGVTVNADVLDQSGDGLSSYFTLVPDENSSNSDANTLISESETPGGEESCDSETTSSGLEGSSDDDLDLWASELGLDSGGSTDVGNFDGASELWNLDPGPISDASNTLVPFEVSSNPVGLDTSTEPQLSFNADDYTVDLTTSSEESLFSSDSLGSGGELVENTVPFLAKRVQTDFCLFNGVRRRTRKKKPPMPMPVTDKTKVGKDGCYEGWEAYCCPYSIPVVGTADCHPCMFCLSSLELMMNYLPLLSSICRLGGMVVL